MAFEIKNGELNKYNAEPGENRVVMTALYGIA